jgi:hypothetical protein
MAEFDDSILMIESRVSDLLWESTGEKACPVSDSEISSSSDS